jgi:hypothetical protein
MKMILKTQVRKTTSLIPPSRSQRKVWFASLPLYEVNVALYDVMLRNVIKCHYMLCDVIKCHLM